MYAKLFHIAFLVFAVPVVSFQLNDENYIIGADGEAKPGQFPWYVHADHLNTNCFCGGSLVAPDVVLSAAHCEDCFGSKVLVGAVKKDMEAIGNAEWREIVGGPIVHPDYDPEGSGNRKHDLMLMKVIPSNKPYIKLNFDDTYPPDNQRVRVVGMGLIESKLEPEPEESDDLLFVDVSTLNSDVCVAIYEEAIKEGIPMNTRVFPEVMLCTSGIEKGVCSGDSGGPVFVETPKLIQVGVVSYGLPDCGTEAVGFPQVTARISGDDDWLKTTICGLTDSDIPFCGSPSKCRAKGTICRKNGIPCCGNRVCKKLNKRAKFPRCHAKGSKCKKKARKCAKKDQDCCGKMVCAKLLASERSPHCLQCARAAEQCGRGKPPCCNSMRCKKLRKRGGGFVKRGGRFVRKCRR